MRKIKTVLIITGMLALVMLSGCGKKDKDLQKYYDNMNKFTNELTKLSDKLNNIDTTDSKNAKTLLKTLDSMELQFRHLSEYDVPEQFASNEELADEAYSYMQEAVSMYHTYYDDPETDINTADAAYENYKRAMKRVEYISIILQGELPEGDNIEVTEQETTDFTPVSDDSQSTDEEILEEFEE